MKVEIFTEGDKLVIKSAVGGQILVKGKSSEIFEWLQKRGVSKGEWRTILAGLVVFGGEAFTEID